MAKQEVQITAKGNEGTVHVDEVSDYQTGIYAKEPDGNILYYHRFEDNDKVAFKSVFGVSRFIGLNLRDLIKSFPAIEAYTIPDNRRIVTTKPLTVEDLKGTDHVGFEYKYEEGVYKGYVANVGDGNFNGIVINDICDDVCNDSWSGIKFKSISEFINFALSNFKSVLVFSKRTGKDGLYQWLAED